MRILRARLLARRRRRRPTARRPTRAARQVRTVDRSERIRTYNFPENRISDHRVGYKAYNLDQVLDGDLDAVVQALRRRRRRRAARRRRPARVTGRPLRPRWPTATAPARRGRRRRRRGTTPRSSPPTALGVARRELLVGGTD